MGSLTICKITGHQAVNKAEILSFCGNTRLKNMERIMQPFCCNYETLISK